MAGEVCTDGTAATPAPGDGGPSRRGPAARGRRRRRRHHARPRALPLRRHRRPGGGQPQPVGHGALTGGQFRRQRGRGRGGLRAGRPRQRRHGLAAAPGRGLRPRHAQAGARCGAGARSVPTAGRAWPRTARSRRPWPIWPSRTPSWRGRSPAPLADPGRPLRIAVSTRSPVPGLRADAPTRAAVDAVVAELVAAGHTVVRTEPADHHRRGAGRAGPVDGRRGGRRRRTRPRPCGAPAAQPYARPHRAHGAPRRPHPTAHAASGSASRWPPSSRTSTCCSPRSPPDRRWPPARGTSARSWPT